MDKERIEIFPGHWIEVTSRIKKKAGLRQSERVLATLRGETMEAATEVARPAGNRKYSRLRIDEAVRIAARGGMDKAVKVTGVGRHSINLRQRQLRRKRGVARVKAVGTRYTLAQKQACVRLAQELMALKEVVTKPATCYGKPYISKRLRWSHCAAFREAGRRLGMNGDYIESAWVQGCIPLTQQPSGA